MESEDYPDDINVLTNPLTTEDGFLNEAAMNELASVIRSTPKTYDRLADDPEWNTLAYTSLSDIVSSFAKSAIDISLSLPDGKSCIPLNTLELSEYLAALLRRHEKMEDCPSGAILGQWSLCEINKYLWETVGDTDVFKSWECGEPILHNTCIIIRNKRRHDAAFNREFDRERSSQST